MNSAMLRIPVVVLAAVAGCTGGPSDSVSPVLEVAHETVLAETDYQFVARPTRLSLPPDGRLFIADEAAGSVMVFGPAGDFLYRLGRLGSGPGEFRSPGVVAFLGDSAVAVEDRRLRVLKLLVLPAGEEFAQVRFDGVGAGTVAVLKDTAWFGVLAPYQDPSTLEFTGLGSLARWIIGDSAAAILWDAPPGLIVDGHVSPLSTLASQEILTDSLGFWVKYGVRDVLERRTREGTLVAEFRIPSRGRRGVPEDLVARVSDRNSWADAAFSPEEVAQGFSQDLALGLARPGVLALVTLDVAQSNDGPDKLHLAILDPERQTACPDFRIPYAGVGRPVVAFRADSLVVLSQEMSEGDSGVRLTARYYALANVGCDVPVTLVGLNH